MRFLHRHPVAVDISWTGGMNRKGQPMYSSTTKPDIFTAVRSAVGGYGVACTAPAVGSSSGDNDRGVAHTTPAVGCSPSDNDGVRTADVLANVKATATSPSVGGSYGGSHEGSYTVIAPAVATTVMRASRGRAREQVVAVVTLATYLPRTRWWLWWWLWW